MTEREYRIAVPSRAAVSATLLAPREATHLYVMGHGAGAGMRHAFLESIARRLAARGIASWRFNFPYMEAGRRSPDPPAALEDTVRAALDRAVAEIPGIPVVAGGKSLGGRIASHVAAQDAPDALAGLVFLGFPLHPPKQPATKRAAHLTRVQIPMLFLQGTRDDLADLTLLGPIVDRLGARATLHVVEGGDHSFGVRKRSGRTKDDVHDELTDTIVAWTQRL